MVFLVFFVLVEGYGVSSVYGIAIAISLASDFMNKVGGFPLQNVDGCGHFFWLSRFSWVALGINKGALRTDSGFLSWSGMRTSSS